MPNWNAMKEQANFIPDDAINATIQRWHNAQPDRAQTTATPSTMTDCPRVVWLKYKQQVPVTSPMTWALKQRLLLGRNFENKIAEQLAFDGMLLHHWQDDVPGQSVKFKMGKGLSRIEGTPDLLLQFNNHVYISDAKTGRSDGYTYVPTDQPAIWDDYFWYKYKLQVTAYYLLSHKSRAWYEANNLPLPDACHLFSFAMDDGIVRRNFMWQPTKADAEAVQRYTERWNRAYASEEMPVCTCQADGGGKMVMFCPYATESVVTKKGKTIGTACCPDDLLTNKEKYYAKA